MGTKIAEQGDEMSRVDGVRKREVEKKDYRRIIANNCLKEATGALAKKSVPGKEKNNQGINIIGFVLYQIDV